MLHGLLEFKPPLKSVAALPRGRVPRQKTLLGKAFTEALSYAPLAALDEDAIALEGLPFIVNPPLSPTTVI